MNSDSFLRPAQLKSELERCLNCEEKPCQKACPVDCSPADFIQAAKGGAPSDFKRSAALILGHNPLGGVCGVLCPDTFCVSACARKLFDTPIRVPEVQATLIQRAKESGQLPEMIPVNPIQAPRVAVVGGGPAGLGAAAILLQKGLEVVIFEREHALGGQMNLIPAHRLDKWVLETDIAYLSRLGKLSLCLGMPVKAPETLLDGGFSAVLMAVGPGGGIRLGVPGDELATDCNTFLMSSLDLSGKKILVVGGGAVAVDCAVTAQRRGGEVEIVYRRRLADMPLTAKERLELQQAAIDVLPKTRVFKITKKGVHLARVKPAAGSDWSSRALVDEPGTEAFLVCDLVVYALGYQAAAEPVKHPRLVYAASGAGTVVEAVATGKNAALDVLAALEGGAAELRSDPLKSFAILSGRQLMPVSLECEFFGRSLRSPFLLSAAPHTDGFEQMRAAYEAGWAGGVMKTAFDFPYAENPIHIPDGYMAVLGERTYGNCDNVSAHSLDRVCSEVDRLVREWPDRLTLASTGGPVTGDDPADCAIWQSNTRKLEEAGAHGIEYSLSCPQGGDGTYGDIVSQDPVLTTKVVEWVMAASNPAVPKLFKLSGAVTSIQVILQAVKEVLARYPQKKAGVTLANSFPGLIFRGTEKLEGVVVGMSGEGILPISNLSLAKASSMGLCISGNGGPMNYKAAATFLALGAETVQFCTVVMKEGLQVIQELESGLSFHLEAKGLRSVREFVGSALPRPITDFLALSTDKHVPALTPELCRSCGNCARCPYQAISIQGGPPGDAPGDPKSADVRHLCVPPDPHNAFWRLPVIDSRKCVGCSLCAQKCFSGALRMVRLEEG